MEASPKLPIKDPLGSREKKEREEHRKSTKKKTGRDENQLRAIVRRSCSSPIAVDIGLSMTIWLRTTLSNLVFLCYFTYLLVVKV
ncbi:hypothetical protein H5410_060155 [Solanum commersonii]|uniref:Uncharacterized protein n=1 Tax=Solanum commersonii TaxID=4109 RepID=A0A9J5W4B5_SOLCO|nr:hypothetical protein H5410_060155 [Solanum commersonii]